MSRARKDAPRKPNLFIVGAPKCGTTAWVEYLRTHPDIFFPDIKEPHYFAADFPDYRGISSKDDYERLFRRAGASRIIGEASVFYLYSTVAARLIREYNPDARVLIFLRPQEQFLQSVHHQFLFTFYENIDDFGTAWRLSPDRPPETLPATCKEPKFLDYAAIGRFAEQVDRYFAEFPRDRIKVIRFEEWTADPRSTYLEILKFLGVRDDGRTDFPRVNEAKTHSNRFLGKLIHYPPAPLLFAVKVIRKLLRRDALHLADRASHFLSRRGYKTEITAELRDEICRYYEEDNRLLNTRLAES